MAKRIILLSLVITFLIAMTSSAMAVGLGGYGSFDYSGGSTKIKHKTRYGTDATGPISSIVPGGGFTIDTNLIGSSLFNYRLRIGGDKFYTDGESDFDGAGAHFFNSFGFKMYGSDRVRLWIGPGFGFRYITGTSSKGIYFGREDIGVLEDIFSTISMIPGDPSLLIGNYGFHTAKSTYTLYAFDAGLVFGMNFAITNLLIISAEVAAKYSLMWGERSRKVTTLLSLTEWSNYIIPFDYRSDKDSITSHCGSVNVIVGILFRVGEGSTTGKKG